MEFYIIGRCILKKKGAPHVKHYLSYAMTVILIFVMSGCLSIYTITDSTNEDDCKFCKNIPRVYSGAKYDLFCSLRADNVGLFIFLLDTPLSIAVDTVALPYTIYQQIKYGSICKDGILYRKGEKQFDRKTKVLSPLSVPMLSPFYVPIK